MAQFTLPNFNRRYVLLPMLSVIALVATAYFTSQDRMEHVKSAGAQHDGIATKGCNCWWNYPMRCPMSKPASAATCFTGDPEYLQTINRGFAKGTKNLAGKTFSCRNFFAFFAGGP